MKKITFLLFTLICLHGLSQNYDEIANLKTGDYEDQTPSLIGLWEVELVTVGDEKMTPIARWFKFLANGRQVSGNGGMEHGRGSWRFDAAASTLLTLDEDGKDDGYGAFKISLTANTMTWERIEEDMNVKVSLIRTDQKPLAPWDKILGTWTTLGGETSHTDSNIVEVYDLEGFDYYFGWDRRYRKFDSAGKRVEIGIWHIEPHSPWLWLIPYEGEKYGQEIIFENGIMTLISKEGTSIDKITFERK